MKIKKVKGSHGLLAFWCPACNRVHQFCVDKRDWPNMVWKWNGEKEKPTFSPSILVIGKEGNNIKRCHSFITNGRIVYLSDSTHDLAGKMVDMVDIPEDYLGLEEWK